MMRTKIFSPFNRGKFSNYSPVLFMKWAEKQAKIDAGIPELEVIIEHSHLSKEADGLYNYGEYKILIKMSLILNNAYTYYLEILRHELEHCRSDILGTMRVLHEKIFGVGKENIDLLHKNLNKLVKNTSVGNSVKKRFKNFKKNNQEIKIKMIVATIDESLAYWHESRFSKNILEKFISEGKIPYFFNFQRMTKNEIDPNSKNIEEKLMLVQSMKEEAKEKILFNEELIENIFNVFSTIGEPELFRLLITIYNKHGYYSEKDFSTVPTQYPR